GLSSHLVCILWVEDPQGHAPDSIGTELAHLKQLSRCSAGVFCVGGLDDRAQNIERFIKRGGPGGRGLWLP
ncbi:hypothetical protein ABTN06_19035, partial [Acinetobacter baumannii]